MKVTMVMSSSSRSVVSGGGSMAKDTVGDGYNRMSTTCLRLIQEGYFGGSGGSSGSESGGHLKDRISGKTADYYI